VHHDILNWVLTCIVCCVQQYDLLSNALGAVTIDPSLFAPPKCHEMVTKKLVEASGGTYRPVTVPQDAQDAQDDDTAAAVRLSQMSYRLALCAAVLGFLSLLL
jgi:hypothetical protein